MVKRKLQPGWLLPKKVGKLKPMSTRNVVKRKLKEWNMDEDEAHKRQKERLRTYDKIPTMVGDEDVWEDKD